MLPRVVWVMLNPSTADAKNDDPTIRRCIDFAKRWGAGSIEVVNLYSRRATDPADLERAMKTMSLVNKHGYDNDAICAAARRAKILVVAWGAHRVAEGRDHDVLRLLRRSAVYCLGTTKAGHPRHPLYVRGDTQPTLYQQKASR